MLLFVYFYMYMFYMTFDYKMQNFLRVTIFFGTMKLMCLELEQIQTLKKKQPTTQTSSQDSYIRNET